MRILVACMLVTVAFSGCAALDELINGLNRPDIPVQRTALESGSAVTDPRFLVVVAQEEPLVVRIEAKAADGRTVVEEGISDVNHPVEIVLPDGTWTVQYFVDGYDWETFEDVMVDSTPPEIAGLDRVGDASSGAYTITGTVAPGERVEVYHRNQLVATSLPYSREGMTDGLWIFTVVAIDEAGNRNPVNVQVRVGEAKALPEGQWDFGIVARYSEEAAVWDLSDLDAYATVLDAQDEAGQWLGEGYGITPNDPVVAGVVDDVLTDEDTTAEIAWALFEWLFDNLEYDDERLDSTTLMLPRQVIDDLEDSDAEARRSQDSGDDGLADDGAGNGVHGGVCRDLAATYVSLLRNAGVPARLVSGYLAGDVQGFHAWVEVYVGDLPGNPGPWMPVDVSPIDGRWTDDANGDGLADGVTIALQAFGIRLPDYLPLGFVGAPEEEGWSTALGTEYTYPEGRTEPEIKFQKDVQIIGREQHGKLCFDVQTMSRSIITAGQCTSTFFDDFVVFTERTIDYGIDVVNAPSGTDIEAELAYPQANEYLVYGQAASEDGDKLRASWRA